MQTKPEPVQDTPIPASASEPTDAVEGKTKKRPRIDMAVEPRERKRGKTMFGLVLGMLKEAKNEDKERNASDAVRHSQKSPISASLTVNCFCCMCACWDCGVGIVTFDYVGGSRPRRGN